MSRDYDSWIYIMTNQTDSVLYIGETVSIGPVRCRGSLRITAVASSFTGSIILMLSKPLREKSC